MFLLRDVTRVYGAFALPLSLPVCDSRSLCLSARKKVVVFASPHWKRSKIDNPQRGKENGAPERTTAAGITNKPTSNLRVTHGRRRRTTTGKDRRGEEKTKLLKRGGGRNSFLVSTCDHVVEHGYTFCPFAGTPASPLDHWDRLRSDADR